MLRYFNKNLEEGIKPSDSIIINDTVDYDKTSLPNERVTEHFLGEFGKLSDQEKYSLINAVLTPNGLNMMVTPKEVDIDINDLAEVISSSIDRSLHTIVQ